MKQAFVLALCLGMASLVYAQEEIRIDVTDFEGDETWAYSGGSVIDSFVDWPVEPVAHSGDLALYTDYDNAGNGWNWAQINFVNGNLDLTGMRELHMWVWFDPTSEGDLTIQADIAGTSLGSQTAPSTGEWHELVWQIDRITSNTRLSDSYGIGGFISPGGENASGIVYIDDIFFLRPAGVPEVEEMLVYSFDEEDPDTLTPMGWQNNEGDPPFVGFDDIEPSQGDNYMEMYMADGWIANVVTSDSKAAFDRWVEITEILIDGRISSDFGGSWSQVAIVLQSGGEDENGEALPNTNSWDSYPNIATENSKDEWKNMVWIVDMSKHIGAFENEAGWFNVIIVTNQAGGFAGTPVYIDNFRVAVPVTTGITQWSLF